ncbi:transposase [Methanoculleus sp.]|uniref:transposase n=1 Tax=Methanoculleus sp. TaxID=90427 RepID=UPI002C56689B|nr:transposase [Methanoculleus sp.]HNT08549.1 transposase [Methanoculleus sp.]
MEHPGYRGERPRRLPSGPYRTGLTPLVKNTEKIRANTFGIFAVNGNSIVTFRERSKQEDIREVLKEFKRANPNKRLIIVLDNFSSHHAILVREYAVENGYPLRISSSILSSSQPH